MAGASLNGRLRSQEKPPVQARHYKTKNPKASCVENLQPAPPPKSNPWMQKRPSGLLMPDWPSITPDFDNASPTPESKVKELVADEEVGSQYSKSCPSTDSKDSDAVLPSSKTLQAAAPRAGDSLWLRPLGADVFVWAQDEIFQVHRYVVEPQSRWLRDNLPPASSKYTPIGVHLPFDHQVVGHTLRFMYTQSLEVLEYNRENPCDFVHIPRCALLYLCAMDLGVEAMKDHIVRVVEQTTQDLTQFLSKNHMKPVMNHEELVAAVPHFKRALEVAYALEAQAEALPLRLSLAKLLDQLLPFLIRHPVCLDLFSDSIWKRHSTSITADLLYSRQVEGSHGDAVGNYEGPVDSLPSDLEDS